MSEIWRDSLFRDNVVATHKISHFLRLRTLSGGGIFLVTFFFAVEEKVTGSKGFETKLAGRQ
ncbi:hypothetical protein [Paraglaciecola aestuariivivens]